MRFTKKAVLLPSILAWVLGLIEPASAAINQQWNQDAAGLGDAQAGSAAAALDASTEFYNPAGLMYIKEQQVVAGTNLTMSTYDMSGETHYGNNATLNEDGSGGTFSPGVFLHYAAPISDQWAFGFGVSSPFSTNTAWSDDSSAAGSATTTNMTTYDVSTDLAYAVTKKFSVGAGFDFVRVIVSDYDNVAQGNANYDTSLSGKQWSTGWHGGILYQLTDAARVGVAYHSKVDYEATGDASATDANGAVLNSTNNFVLSSTLPAYTTASVYYTINPKLALEGSVSYTQWDQAGEVTYQNLPTDTGVTAETTQSYDLQNTWRTALGVHYSLTGELMLRGGVGYETSPYTDTNEVYLGAPVGSSYDASAGLQYKHSKTLAFDLGWTHMFYLTQDVNTTNATSNSTTAGQFSGSNDVLGIQVRWDMV